MRSVSRADSMIDATLPGSFGSAIASKTRIVDCDAECDAECDGKCDGKCDGRCDKKCSANHAMGSVVATALLLISISR